MSAHATADRPAAPAANASRFGDAAPGEYLLEAIEVSKQFPGVKALEDVTLRLRPGSVHALMGENGAGKSTLMKILAGVIQPTTGDIRALGVDAYIQDIVKGLIIIAAVMADQYRRGGRRNA